MNTSTCYLTSHEIIIQGELNIWLEGDESRLEQVANNLLSNAIKYSPAADKILVEAVTENNRLKISIIDFGIGIEKGKIPHVFDRFFRVEETSHKFSGLGLGLYISREIIKRHGGKIGVESEPGKGSTFNFSIPIQAAKLPLGLD